MSPVEQSSPAMSYYSTSIPSTSKGTTPNYSWPLSPSTSLSIPDYWPYALGLTFNPASTTTYNPYACNHLLTAVPTSMSPSPSVSTANCARPIDAFGAAPRPYGLHSVNNMQPLNGFLNLCTFPDSLAALRDTVSRSHPMRRRAPPLETHADPVISKTAPMELALADMSLPEVAPPKRSRTAQACQRCRGHKGKCFGDPFGVQASADAHDGDPPPEPPALGLGLELNPAAIDEYADGKSDPDFGNPSSAPVFVSNSISSTLWGFGTGFTITVPSADAILHQRLTGMGGGLELYMPLDRGDDVPILAPSFGGLARR
ncbi:hypothetical protein EHS25_004811 [Saitozyma podzolica]|uniref:Uncharacterized protein n=1 Tax=Saitozyma podzolica TaxID=1890683 RepID=A0A427Y366_9TREE|nr:hypothetical protein EHS25_004811 [Saitozyma podzolica]